MTRCYYVALAALTLSIPCAYSQTPASPACSGSPLTGTVRDNTLALLPGAIVTLDTTTTSEAGPDGRFRFACVTPGKHDLSVKMEGFAQLAMKLSTPRTSDLDLRLQAGTEVSITVEGDGGGNSSSATDGGSLVLAGKQLEALADDPDDLLRELQQMAAASGGSPSGTIISVDGFSDSAKLPPKDSIAFINVAPDLFSTEYREPPFGGGGRVEVYTKPGAKAYHGSLFATNSSSFMNARDAFTTSTGSLGKQRYGFSFTGPIRKQGSNFTLNLEHRAIDEEVAVNAITPDSLGNPFPTLDTVPIPQRLWEGNARVDWQLGPKNIAFVSFSANVNHQQNLNVGGQTLRVAGYDSGTTDYTVRASNVTTVSAQLVHEARLSFEHAGAVDIPMSTAPSLQVAGYFTGGGATVGNERDSNSHTEFDDDILLNTKRHLIKTGIQALLFRRNFILPTSFNGTYIFAGSTTATGYQTPLQQYQQAQTGGTATEFNNVAGNPNVITTQLRFAAFFQDNLKLSDKWSASYGLRYFFETDPANFNGISPRAGAAYTPDKKKTWVLRAHAGIFNGQFSSDEAQELHREDGVQRVTSLIYNPVYGTPFAGATPIHAERTRAPGLNVPVYLLGELSISKDLPMGFNINTQIVGIRLFTDTRTVNINQPTGPNPTPSPYGPRPFGPDLNILQLRNDGSGQGLGQFFGISNFKLKHAQFFLGGLHLNLRDDTNDDSFAQPQSAYTDAGERAHRTKQGLWQVFGNANLTLPYKVSFSMNGNANSGNPFNITTGNDNNGDGNFNDRPQYAAPGAVVDNTTVFNTPFGVLTNNGPIVNGIPLRPIQRNLGVLPWSFHLDANLQRAFELTRDPKAVRQQTITANVRSANFLNHTNVLAEGSVLNNSPQFLAPISADTARRLEFGLRYSF